MISVHALMSVTWPFRSSCLPTDSSSSASSGILRAARTRPARSGDGQPSLVLVRPLGMTVIASSSIARFLAASAATAREMAWKPALRCLAVQESAVLINVGRSPLPLRGAGGVYVVPTRLVSTGTPVPAAATRAVSAEPTRVA